MGQVIAVHDIHYAESPGKAATLTTPAVPPVNKIIKSGTVFSLEQVKALRGEEDNLRDSGAIRDPEVAGRAKPKFAPGTVEVATGFDEITEQPAVSPVKSGKGKKAPLPTMDPAEDDNGL